MKYGCSSGDINPVGSVNKQDLRSFLKWAAVNLGYSSLSTFEAAQTNSDGLVYSQTLILFFFSKLASNLVAILILLRVGRESGDKNE